MRRHDCLPSAFVWALLTAATPCTAAETTLEPLVTNESRFEIPLEIEAGDPTLAEVRLYYSVDAGKSWNLALKAKPPLGGFMYQAPHDGEFWFAVRTADAAGQEESAGELQPELRVVVDSQPPQIDLRTERSPSGDVLLRWNCRDRSWRPDSLKVSYRTAPDADWQAVHSLKTKRHDDAAGGGGEIEWTPPTDATALDFKLEVQDVAGNTAVKETTPPTDAVARHDPPAAALPTPNNPRSPLWVNSLAFELEYDVGRIDPASVEKVTVFGTDDGGRTWSPLGVDDDGRSPCAVNVDREGMYGFTIVVTAGGESTPPPNPGDRPEIRVGVDLQKPQVRLTTAEPDSSGKPCVMKINWQATDEHLGLQPVSLAYAAGPQGPWLPLALGVANDGGRFCEFDPAGPDAVYLRIEVRDEAGNLGAFSTTAPLPVEKRDLSTTVVGLQRGLKAPPKWFHVLR